jgi:hypothetical protein
MTATREYVNKTNEFLQQEAALNALNVKAFKDIERPFFIKPMEEKAEEINLERNIAETNLKQITTSDEVAKGIVQSLVNNNELSTFNRYFSVFQRALKNQKVQSLGQFSNIFNNFKTNIVTDISKTGLLPAEEIIQNVQNITKTLNIPTAIPSDLNVLTEGQIDEIFRNAVKAETKNEPFLDQVLDIKTADGRKDMKIRILDTRGYIKIKPADSKKGFDKNGEQNAKIRYIIKVYRPNLKITPKLVKWAGNIAESFNLPDISEATQKSPVGSPVGSPEAEAEVIPKGITKSMGEFASGSGLTLLRNSRTNYMMGRGIKSQKKS